MQSLQRPQARSWHQNGSPASIPRSSAVQRRVVRVSAAIAAPPTATDAKPRIAVTCGDPAGIGPEVVLKAISDPSITEVADITIFGSAELLARSHKELCQSLKAHRRGVEWLPDLTSLPLHDVALKPWVIPGVVPHLGTNASGEASYRFLEAAITETMAGESCRAGGVDAHGIT